MIGKINSARRYIAGLWLVVMLSSLGLIVFHNHDHLVHNHEQCASDHSHDQHDHHHDCAYCFLFFQQQIHQIPSFHWALQSQVFELSPIQLGEPNDAVQYQKKYSKGLRAPPFPSFTIIA